MTSSKSPEVALGKVVVAADEEYIKPTTKNPVPKEKETPSLFRKKKESGLAEVAEKVIREEDFTEAQLQEAWSSFIELRKSQVIGEMEQLILSSKLTKKESEVVVFLNNSLEISIFERIEFELLAFFREALGNDRISLIKEVKEDTQKQKLYTSKDKYDFMLAQNPALQTLKDRLGLDFEY